MHYYIYDTFTNDKKYATALIHIESRLMELGINGRIEKLTILKSLPEVVNEAVQRGADTIIAVGNDDTISKMVSLISNQNITFGIIPIGPDNRIATLLGIPEGVAACDVLSARITRKIDLGKANNSYFITSLAIPYNRELVVDCGNYLVSPMTENSTIQILNLSTEQPPTSAKTHSPNPTDGLLEAVFTAPQKSGGFLGLFSKHFTSDSVFPVKKAKIKCASECLPAIADGHTTVKTPITVEIAPKKLKVIVGKHRMF